MICDYCHCPITGNEEYEFIEGVYRHTEWGRCVANLRGRVAHLESRLNPVRALQCVRNIETKDTTTDTNTRNHGNEDRA